VRRRLQTIVGHRITIAGYWALTSPTLFGLVIWDDDLGEMFELPYEPNWYELKRHIELTQTGLKISIQQRLDFAKSLSGSRALDKAAQQATAALLRQMVRDPSARTHILSHGLSGVLDDVGCRGLEDWVACPIFHKSPWQLGDPAITQLNAVFDLSGFAPEGLFSRLLFSELLPKLE
jgi:hypothetical protein